jgi:hypothetical protein
MADSIVNLDCQAQFVLGKNMASTVATPCRMRLVPGGGAVGLPAHVAVLASHRGLGHVRSYLRV